MSDSFQKIAILLVGLQGAGKSTIVSYLLKKGYLSLGMSEAILWRTNNSQSFAQKYPQVEFYDKGIPYPDTAVAEAFFARISAVEGKNLVLDACTRTVDQVDMVVTYLKEEGYQITVVHLVCAPEECKVRIAHRVAYCEAREMEVRADDKDPEAIERRFEHHFKTILGILDRFKLHFIDIHEVDTEMPVDVVQAQVVQKLGGRIKVSV